MRDTRYARRKKAGLCTACGKNPPTGGTVTCRPCRVRENEYERKRKARRRADGLCAKCGKRKAINGSHKCRKCRQIYKELYEQLRDEVFAAYGGYQCACCGDRHREFLHIDHADGGGRQHRKKIKTGSGSPFYSWLKRNGFPPGFRVLCANCNLSLGHYGYCPHQRDKEV